MYKSITYDMLYMNNSNPLYREITDEVWGSNEFKMNSFLSFNQINNFIAKLDFKEKSVFIDICCGEGKPLIQIAKKTGCTAYGLDFNQQSIDVAIQIAKKINSDVNFINVDLIKEKIPFQNASIDRLMCIDSISHFSLDERIKLFKEWHRVLKPGAKILFTDPFILNGAISHTQIAKRCILGKYFVIPGIHIQKKLLQQIGFEVELIEDITNINGNIIPRKWRLAREKRKEGLILLEQEKNFYEFNNFLQLSEELFTSKILVQYAYHCIKG